MAGLTSSYIGGASGASRQGGDNGKVPQQQKNARKPKPKTKEATKKQSMLNTHKITPFKYDMNEILASTSMDASKASSFLATVIAKASRQSTRDAKDFIRTFLDSGDLTKEENDRICRLLDKYSKYR